jgi:hypothetical protein
MLAGPPPEAAGDEDGLFPRLVLSIYVPFF